MEGKKAHKAFRYESNKKENFPTEVIRRVTKKGHEVIDVDGLIVCRKKSLQGARTEQPAASVAVASPAQCAENRAQLDAEPVAHSEDRGQLEGGQRLQASPTSSARGADLENADTMPTAGAGIEEAGPRSPAHFTQDWTDSSCQAQAEECLASLPEECVDQSQRLVQLCNSLKEFASGEMFQEHQSLEAQDFASAVHSISSEFTGNVRNGLGSTLICHTPAPARGRAAYLLGKQAELLTLQKWLQAAKQEEAEWLEQQGEAERETSSSDQARAAIMQQNSEQLGVHDGSQLQAASLAAHRTLSCQVVALQSLVTSLENLERTAEIQCSAMQADYHNEKFRTFPHVDSPARLIRELVKPRKMRLALSSSQPP